MGISRLTLKSATAGFLLFTGTWLSGATVASVQLEQQGSGKIAEPLLRHCIRLRPGITYTREFLDEDVKNLYRTGNFADVQSQVDYVSRDKVNITFKLRLKERIGKLSCKGNVKFSSAELGKLITISEGGLLNSEELRKSANALRKFYQDRGYKDATVTPMFIPAGDNKTDVEFRINENLRLKVDQVKFDGATVFSQFKLRHSIANQYSYMNWLPFLNNYLNMGLLDRAELAADRARLREKYYDAGYLDFKVKKTDIVSNPKDPEFVNLTFTVDEGKPYTVGKISFTGNKIFDAKRLESYLRIHTKERFSLTKENATCTAVQRLYETLGYAEISCRAVRFADPKTHVVNLRFDITEGKKYMVRDVLISGNKATKEKVIRRELVIQPGDPVDRQRIEISRKRLLGMGYFSKVETVTSNADSPDEKDVSFRLEESKKRYNFRIAAGISDVNSLFGMAEASIDNFDILNPKGGFYGGGQRARLQGIIGIQDSGFQLNFVEPWLFDKPLRWEVTGYMNTSSFENWDEWRVGGRTSLQRKIFDDFTTINAGYKFEVVRVNHIDDRLKDYVNSNNLDGTFRVSQVSLSLGRDTRDSLVDPTEGYNINLFGSITPMMLGSTSNYHRLEAKGSYYKSFFDKFLIAMVGAKIGTVSTFDNDKDVPLFERYFLGGGNTLRGFGYREVGPTVNRENVGGQTMMVVTAEISHAIWGPIRGAVFCDIGNAWGDHYHMNFSSINIGAGYGLRIKVPMLNVPIRLDLAYPVLNNQDACSNKLRVHFNVGAGFSL